MAAFRSVKPKDTYEDWLVQMIKFLTPPANANAHSLDIIMDNYIERSVKEGTRQNRAGDPGPRTYITGFHQKMPQLQRWLQLLNNGDSKNELISLFVKFLKSPERRRELKKERKRGRLMKLVSKVVFSVIMKKQIAG